MDLDPEVPVGIRAQTMRFIDVFLLHCLLSDSPLDSPDEIAALGRNQHRTAAYGREPGLRLERGGAEVALVDWAAELLAQCDPIAARLDAVQGGTLHAQALAAARAALDAPATLPSARLLATMARDFGGSHVEIGRAQSEQVRNHLVGLPWSQARQAAFESEARASVAAARAIEQADTVDFETFRLAYLAPEGLELRVPA